MTVTIELTANEYRNMAWSGAVDTCNDLTDGEIQMIMDTCEEMVCYDDEPMTLTALNDFFWFERDTIAEWLGYEDYDELMRDRNGEEETW